MLALKDIGILPAKEKQFNKKGIFEVNDLLSFFPRNIPVRRRWMW